MFDTSSAGIESAMDVSLEEELQAVNLDEAMDDEYDDDEDVVILEDGPIDFDFERSLDEVELPPEMNDYLNTLESQTRHLEKELEECDELLKYSPSLSHSRAPSQAVMVYDDYKELERAAAEQGLTVEEFKQKVLTELEQNDFTEEDLDKEYEEFVQLQKELAEVRSAVKIERNKEMEDILAIEAPPDENTNANNSVTGDNTATNGNANDTNLNDSTALVKVEDQKLEDLSSAGDEVGPLVSLATLSSMRDFIHEQLKKADEWHEVKKKTLLQSIENHKHEEEKMMLEQEGRKKKIQQQIRIDEVALLEKKEEQERIIEEETKVRDAHTEEELNSLEQEIQKLSEALEEEKYQYNLSRKAWMDRLEQTKKKAAVCIQKVYRGHRTRKANKSQIQEMEEWKELKKKEKYDLRVMELEYEIKHREEEVKRQKEEERQKEAEEKKREEQEEREREMERQKKEEEAKIAEEMRIEEERKKEEQRLEDERRKKEEEEERKKEEKRRKEEEKLRKEEEKKRKEEEKAKQKEEEKRRKEEEKKLKEEEKRQKAEEKKRKEEEERKKKEEEKKKKAEEEEKKKRDEEEKRETEKVIAENDNKAFVNDKDDSTKIYENFIETQEVNKKGTGPLENPSQPSESTATEVKPQNNQDVFSSNKESKQHTSSPSPIGNHIPHPPLHPPNTTASSETTKPSKAATPPSVDLKPAVKVLTPESVPPLPELPPKPDPVELQRLSWIKSCVPWSKVSNEPWKLKQPAVKIHRRPGSAKKLPPVSESVVLAAAHAETMRQVSSVSLVELPGCSLSTLGQCWSLRYLTITNCNLVSLDGLGQCKHLHYISAQHNNIEFVDLKDLGSLQVVRLSHNKLSVIHGLDGCINLRWLDLSHNRITRISGLGSLRRIHSLNLSHNQIVGDEGIDEVVTLQYLDLSHNYLQRLSGIDKMCLLTQVNLSANNLVEVPELKNQVLLQELILQENSIKSLDGLGQFWLPLLHKLNCSQNMLESVEGLDKLVMLTDLDLGSNQITELDSLSPNLVQNQRLKNLVVEGNPLIDVYTDEYKTNIVTNLPFLKSLDRESIKSSEDSSIDEEDEFLQMCSSQVKLHRGLTTEFEMQMKVLLTNPHVTSETLCSTIYSYCDTSFKMASEHRSAHEYGDINVSSSISKFTSLPSSNINRKSINDTAADKRSKVDATVNRKSQFESAINKTSPRKSIPDGKSQFDSFLAKKSKFDAVVASQNHQTDSSNFGSVTPQSSWSSSVGQKTSQENSSAKPGFDNKEDNITGLQQNGDGAKKGLNSKAIPKSKEFNYRNKTKDLSDSSDMSDSEDENDIKKSGANNVNAAYHQTQSTAARPAPASYMNEKDKFEMALQGKSGKSASQNQVSVPNNFQDPKSKSKASYSPDRANLASQYMSEKERFELALQSQKQTENLATNPKDKFNAMFQATENSSKMTVPSQNSNEQVSFGGRRPLPGVKADVVGNQLISGVEGDMPKDFDMAAFGLDGDFDMEGLDFDIDKYLDMGELDEFLEKGWRPQDSPQLPQSSYPVLGKINPAGDMNFNNNSNNTMMYKGFNPTPPPPGQPGQAWRDSPVTELRGKPPRPSQGPGVVPPLSHPSPSPSSVASHAETLGGGSVRSKKDELSDEWGFKDSRTAEMMMARAKKMKYNADRRRKISKLDPQQRLQLFRKLEESGKIQTVRPPPAKILPRKEYFQAREEEAHRQEVERRVEENAKVHRTFEWLHTQVGDHPISSSRINPGTGPIYSNTDNVSSRYEGYGRETGARKTSPSSDHMDSVSIRGQPLWDQGRRYSIGDTYGGGHTPSLPPIQVGSAPSSHKSERISFRDNPVEKSGGWGGGKKRGSKK